MTRTEPATTTPADLPPLPAGLFCPQCDYDLRGLTSARCPECGLSLAGVREGRTLIPWRNRTRRNWYWAYWLTVGMVTLHLRRLGDEVIRPGSFADARAFRRLTVLHVYALLLPISIVVLVRRWDDVTWLFGGLTIPWFVAQQVALLLTLFAVTALPRFFFHPRHLPLVRQNRAVALSYYACGVLAWAPVIAVLVGGGWLARAGGTEAFAYAWVVAFLCVLLVPLWWFALLALARRALRAGPFRLLLMAVGLPVLWAAVGALILTTIPLAVLYVVLAVCSLAGGG